MLARTHPWIEPVGTTRPEGRAGSVPGFEMVWCYWVVLACGAPASPSCAIIDPVS